MKERGQELEREKELVQKTMEERRMGEWERRGFFRRRSGERFSKIRNRAKGEDSMGGKGAKKGGGTST